MLWLKYIVITTGCRVSVKDGPFLHRTQPFVFLGMFSICNSRSLTACLKLIRLSQNSTTTSHISVMLYVLFCSFHRPSNAYLELFRFVHAGRLLPSDFVFDGLIVLWIFWTYNQIHLTCFKPVCTSIFRTFSFACTFPLFASVHNMLTKRTISFSNWTTTFSLVF